jgi:hypothetical protein
VEVVHYIFGRVLTPSIYHASNVGLGVSLSTGLVSPTFHAINDDSFTTVNSNMMQYVPKS